MSPIPQSLREYLLAPSLMPLWEALRNHLERNGHVVQGSVTVELDDNGADRLGGLLGRSVSSGMVRVRLADLDASFHSSAAARGLVPVVADLTSGPLRNLPAERDASRAGRLQLWAELDRLLALHELAAEDWVGHWARWLHRSGVLSRLPTATAVITLSVTVQVLARILDDAFPPTILAELASEITGDAHGLDDGVPAAALVLRALAFAVDVAPATSAAERRALWQRVGVSTDEVSGTVITWALRPPGTGRWSAMMRERADLGLITHLTLHELRRADDLTRRGEVIHACENPQVLQRLAWAGVERPVACMSGNPAAAGAALLSRATVRYHGDFDWPGIAIARRIFGYGAQPWKFGRGDYAEAVARLPAEMRLALSGRVEPTPWDEGLCAALTAADVAIHEEMIIDLLLADLH